MFFDQSKLPKFILFSLVIHVAVVAVLITLKFEHQHPREVEISFSQGAKGDGKPKNEVAQAVKKSVPKIKPTIKSEVIAPDAPKSENQKEVVNTTTAEGGTGTNIGTGEVGEGFGSRAGQETVKNKYKSLVAKIIYKNLRYPRQAYSLNQEGIVVVGFKINKQGKISDLKVLDGSPFKSLSNASLELMNGIDKFPPIPDELKVNEITFTIPIEYKIEM